MSENYLTPQERAYLERELVRRAIQLAASQAGVEINDDQLATFYEVFSQAIGLDNEPGPRLDN